MMARARNIKPGFYKNEELAECSVWARLIFPGLWMLADREGRLEDRPKRIKAELLPFDGQDMDKLLAELERHGFIERYKNTDGAFIQISKFLDHQSPHYSEKPSAIKPPRLPEKRPDDDAETPGVTPPSSPEDSGSEHPIMRGSQPPDSLNPDSLNPESQTSPQEDRGEARATRLPHHWRPGEALMGYTRAFRPLWADGRIEHERAQFVDHYVSTGEKRADWDAAWRKWVRGAKEEMAAPRAAGTRAEARAKWASELTGGDSGQRTIDGTAERVG